MFAAVSAWAHSHGIRLLRYLDDWLVLSSSEAVAKKNVQDLLSLCHSLGIVVIEEKSDLVPSQTASYLSMTIDTGTARIFPALTRVEKFLSVAESFHALSAPPAQLWQVLLRHLNSLEMLIPHSRLRMSSLQWHLKTHWSPESDHPSLLVPLFWEVREGLSCWMVRDHLLKGDSIWDTSSRSTPVLGCVSVGVGLTPPRSCRVRGVVGAGEVITHQSFRDEGNVFGIAVISGGGHRSLCDPDV